MTIDRWIGEAAAATPDRPALAFDGETLDYRALADRIDARTEGLRQAGVTRGSRVAWYGLNHAEVFVLLFACARLGAILVPLNWRLAEAEIAAILSNAEPDLLLYDSHFAEAAGRFGRPAHHWRDPLPQGIASDGQASEDDPLLLVYTSGSTGRPKGVVLTQKALIANAAMGVEAQGLSPASRVLNVLPLFHVGGLNILPTPAFSIGATVYLHRAVDPEAILATLPDVTHAILVPTILQAVMAQPGWPEVDLEGLTLSIGSTDVPVELIDAVQARGVPLAQVYGATETAPYAIYQTAAEAMAHPGSIGRAGSLCAVRLVAGGRDVAEGEPGEIWVRGDNILRDYWRAPDLTAEALVDGWFRTGDVATRDAEGRFWFTDRIKHVIISGGENIYPAEIERVLRRHPKIREVAVVGRPDPKWGEVPVAVVVGDLDGDAVMAALDGQIARYKRPRDVVFVDALPRNAMGKVVAAEVRAML